MTAQKPTTAGSTRSRAWLVPEVLQTSSMDCGPAALKSLLDGLGLPLHFGRLREACQTQVDGTSIDTLEEAMVGLGLDAEQILIPLDHLLSREVHALPALAVMVRPGGYTHFVVLWNRVGNRVQVMDPAIGRRWLSLHDLERELFVAERAVPRDAFREYAGSDEFEGPLARRLAALVPQRSREGALALARADASWRSFAALDAATRAVEQLDAARTFASSGERARLLERWFDEGRTEGRWVVPRRYAYASPAGGDAPADEVTLRGIVLVRARHRAQSPAPSELEAPPAALDLARRTRESSDARRLSRLIGASGQRKLLMLAALTLVLALGIWLEPLMLRGLLDLDLYLGDGEQRLAAGVTVVAALALLALAEARFVRGGLELGARLEGRLRVEFLYALPRLKDAYFQSRPISDLAERAHMVHWLRNLPEVWLSILRLVLGWLATAAGLIWLEPSNALRVVVSALVCLGLPLAFARGLGEHDRRLRTQVGALSKFYYDTLRGLPALAAHAGERALRAEHEAQLTDWKRAGLALAKLGTALEAVVSLSSACCSAWLFWTHLDAETTPVAALLYLYWCLSFPTYGRDLALLSRQLPALRNLIGRVLEALGPDADEHPPLARDTPERDAPGRDGAIAFAGVTVHAGGHTVLQDIDIEIDLGEHVAIVGASGAGKSTLLGLLLGWYTPSSGRVTQGGRELDVTRLRERSVWVDPTVQLYDRSLHANLTYGSSTPAPADLSATLADAELEDVVAELPLGLQTPLGEGGCRLSGGEGQRVRLARGLLRERPELVLLDEPFRGLDREQRSRCLASVRQKYLGTTLLFATHDVHDAASFERVLVFHDGRIACDGPPQTLLAEPASQLRRLLDEERALLGRVRTDPRWRRFRLDAGELIEAAASQGRAPDRRSPRMASANAEHAASTSAPRRARVEVAS